MIFDTLEHCDRYGNPGSRLAAAFDYLRATDLDALPVGRIDLDGENLYALVQAYETRLLEQGQWEAHRQYIDVQYVSAGVERMGFANLATMRLGEYAPERDFQALAGDANFMDVFAGSFVVFFPEDGHMPGLCVAQPAPVRKVVLKLRVES